MLHYGLQKCSQNLNQTQQYYINHSGTTQPPECDNDDFAIALQTPLQTENQMQKTFRNEQTICIDSTFGTTSYNFTLITVLVVDEYGEGYPVACQ